MKNRLEKEIEHLKEYLDDINAKFNKKIKLIEKQYKRDKQLEYLRESIASLGIGCENVNDNVYLRDFEVGAVYSDNDGCLLKVDKNGIYWVTADCDNCGVWYKMVLDKETLNNKCKRVW